MFTIDQLVQDFATIHSTTAMLDDWHSNTCKEDQESKRTFGMCP